MSSLLNCLSFNISSAFTQKSISIWFLREWKINFFDSGINQGNVLAACVSKINFQPISKYSLQLENLLILSNIFSFCKFMYFSQSKPNFL